ncbi:MAG: ABC transporter ATP-binding protein [Flavobacteriaceae bacterium]|nr:MAG: ABC transporter ATP-binding protein [Flavobacteriaceae bacterium]
MSDHFQIPIHLENVSAVYHLPNERIFSIKEYVIRMLKRQVSYNKLVALDRINLQVGKGEVFGVIGRNGAGKSTLLKIISRVLPPVEGRIRVTGRVAPLLGLGAGFNPELTGKENIFLNGAIMCLTKNEIEDRIEKIIEFSELGDFIDAPLRTYSTGMVARLGFSVATALNPDILIIDEILSVGDENFKIKSYERILEYKDKGLTIMLVSHNLNVIEALCDRVMWIDKGQVQMISNPVEVVQAYRADFSKQKTAALSN